MEINELQDKKIAILGFWLEGQSTLNFLLERWVKPESIAILDQKTDIKKSNKAIEYILWEEYLSSLGQYDYIFKTPGISPYHPKIARHKAKLTSQLEIFFDNYKGKVIGVTATKGKSTTVTLLYETLKAAWADVKLVWNIGQPVLDEISIDETHDYVVYELSSFMLEGYKPKLEVGLLGNIFRCHLDWHNDSFEIYKQAKHNALEGAKHRITNIDLVSQLKIPHLRYFGTDGDYMYKDGAFFIHGQEVMNDEGILLKWKHNRINITGVIAVGDTIDIDNELFVNSLKKVLTTFKWLPHRLQEVWTYKKITFVDDSISTTPESTMEAIKTYSWNIGTLFLWGHGYGCEFEKFGKFIADQKIENIIFFPDTGEDIKRAIDATGHQYNHLKTDSMEKAVEFAYKNSQPWQIALLSCASPSYSMYNNFKERGTDFSSLAKKLS